jgi:ferritin-like metal-binding protein YciE
VSNKTLSTIDECFRIMSESPMKGSGRLHDVFVEDFRKDLSEIKSPAARHLYILTKAHHLNQLRIGEYVALIEAADVTGHYGIGLLLATCLADKMAFVERTRHLIRSIVESKIEARRM